MSINGNSARVSPFTALVAEAQKLLRDRCAWLDSAESYDPTPRAVIASEVGEIDVKLSRLPASAVFIAGVWFEVKAIVMPVARLVKDAVDRVKDAVSDHVEIEFRFRIGKKNG